MFRRIFRFFIRISAFLRKEIFEVLRQPRLVITLVLGPFLILLLFGIGYRNTGPPLRTLFVVEPGSSLREEVERQAGSFGPALLYSGVMDDLEEAQELLRENEVDVVVHLPENPYETIRQSEQGVLTLYHDEIDPIQADYIRVFGQVYVDELNRRVLSQVAEQGQQESAALQDTISATRQNASAMRQALEQGNAVQAREEHTELEQGLGMVGLGLAATTGLLDIVGPGDNPDGEETESTAELLSRIRSSSDDVGEIEEGQGNYDEEIAEVTQIEEDLSRLETMLAEFQQISPQVLASPFRSETHRVADVPLELTDFYAPAVIALLVQHIAISFAALSIVRERLEGAIDLFRVSPLSPLEVLLGKYASYFIFEAILSVVLTLLAVYALGVPMLGRWENFALILGALIFSSLGYGFVISMMAQTTTQAVQFSMIVLLASIFFSGFFLALHLLWEPIRIVSWMIPVTYAIQMLQNVMLRGSFGNVNFLYYLTAIGVGFFALSWVLLRRLMMEK